VGRKRISESERMGTITINLRQKVIDEIAKEGKPKKVIENLILEKFENKTVDK
jgi:hypothetical protein